MAMVRGDLARLLSQRLLLCGSTKRLLLLGQADVPDVPERLVVITQLAALLLHTREAFL